MAKRKTRLAICYDFDGTLAPGNMQEFEFVPDIGMTTDAFWAEVKQLAEKHRGDNILIYMWLMLEKARAARVPVLKDNIEAYGATIPLFDGVEDWFDRIDAYGKDKGLKVGHFIISSGLREMIAGTCPWRIGIHAATGSSTRQPQCFSQVKLRSVAGCVTTLPPTSAGVFPSSDAWVRD